MCMAAFICSCNKIYKSHTRTHTPTENNTPNTDAHTHDKNNTPNHQTNNHHKVLNNARKWHEKVNPLLVYLCTGCDESRPATLQHPTDTGGGQPGGGGADTGGGIAGRDTTGVSTASSNGEGRAGNFNTKGGRPGVGVHKDIAGVERGDTGGGLPSRRRRWVPSKEVARWGWIAWE